MTRGNDDAVEKLTEAQREVLRLVLVGYKSKEIAHELGVGVDAINKRLAAAKAVLNAPSRFAAARQLAAFEGRQPSHSLVSQTLAVEANAVDAPPFAPSTSKEWGDEQPRHDHRVEDIGGEYVVKASSAGASASAFAAGQLFATPMRVFILALLFGAIAASLFNG